MRRKYRSIALFAFAIILIILANSFYIRLDLTSDKRYTLSEQTQRFIENLDRDIYFEIYLEGNLPPAFNRLKQRTCEILEELNSLSGGKIFYRTFDPTSINDNKEKQKLVKKLVSMGIQPTNINRKTSEENLQQQLIFPGLLLWDKKTETSINLLKNNPSLNAEDNINNSIEALEYEIISAIRLLYRQQQKNIGFLTGHGELSKKETADIGYTLANYYHVERIECRDIIKDINKYSAIVIARPRKDFSEEDKFAIDQYVMHGGKLLWLIDQVDAHIDSLRYKENILAMYRPMNLEDMLFHYGARINPNLILDGRSALIPVKTSLPGEAPKFTPAPWYYSPLVIPENSHPIGKNINPVRFDFTNSIDTVGENPEIKKDVLLRSSEYTRIAKVPTRVSMNIVEEKMTPDKFNKKHKILGLLLSGKFTSLFRYRSLPENNKISFNPVSPSTKMIVISDGDIIKNQVRGSGENTQIIPLGYDRYTGQTFGNKSFILNAINYLCDEQGWMELRKREFKLSLLNKTKLKQEKRKWQFINIIVPLVFVWLLGFIWIRIRKKRYSRRLI
jgi:ABC-2 type transport system permease protein